MQNFIDNLLKDAANRSDLLSSTLMVPEGLRSFIEACLGILQGDAAALIEQKRFDLKLCKRFFGKHVCESDELLRAVFFNPENALEYQPENIDDFFLRVFVENAFHQPLLITHLKIFHGSPIRYFDRDLPDFSPMSRDRFFSFCRRNLRALKGYSEKKLSSAQRINKKTLCWYFQNHLEQEPFKYHGFLISPLQGPHTDIPLYLKEDHLITSKQDADHYLIRLAKLDLCFQSVIESLRENEKRGYSLPRFSIEEVIVQLEAMLPDNVEDHELYSDFMGKISDLNIESAVFEKQLLICLKKVVYPAYQLLIHYFKQCLNSVKRTGGVCEFFEGEKFYNWCLKHETTTNLKPKKIHRIGLDEVNRVEKLIWSRLDRLGRSRKITITDHLNDISQDPMQLYQDDDWKTEALEDVRQLERSVSSYIERLFEMKPRSTLKIKPVPLAMEPFSPVAFYMQPSLDGSKPGVYFLNLFDRKSIIKFRMPTLFFHEAIPGHHFQLSLQMEDEKLPLIMKCHDLSYHGFIEGWALYAEELMWEEGFYASDPYGELGFLADALMRASRLVVDTGIHAFGWSRTKAVDYMLQHSGQSEGDVHREVDRYFVLPGQACSYMLGKLFLLDLRRQWKGDLPSFHSFVLKRGAPPLEMFHFNH